MFNLAIGEKKLLSLINATVSHEMRNPINSIKSQCLQLKMLINKIKELLSNTKITSVKKLKKKLRKIIIE
jgi:signal transduction histidine kinase